MVKIEDILEDIKRDFATFADPTAEVVVTSSSVIWKQGRRDRQATLVSPATKGFPDIIEEGVRYSYTEFFASSRMADLRALAQSIYLQTHVIDDYVGTLARVDEVSTGIPAAEDDGRHLVRRLATHDLPYMSTRIVFVRGKAGAGKTEMLRQLTREQASRYIAGGGGSLLFYVDAQARALSRLNEAMSLILQDLRASFTYHSVSTLARLGLLIPVIDGFDELLGTGGYREAFSSLARFLQSLDSSGALIVSARATFFQFSDFRHAASRLEDARVEPLNYEIVPITALPWSHQQVAEYLQKRGVTALYGAETADDSAARLRAALGSQAELLLDTPFFVARIAELLQRSSNIDLSGRVVPLIVSDFIDRETRKMIDTTGSPLITREQHFKLLEAVAEEMLQQETLTLDTGTLRVLVEMTCDDFALDSRAEQAVVEKFSSHALLDVARDGSTNRVSFHHEFYYAYFLARALADALQSARDVSGLFGRGGFSAVVCRELVLELRDRQVSAAHVLTNLDTRRITSLTRDVSRRNAGLLYEQLIREWHDAANHARIRQAIFEFSNFASTSLTETVFETCEFRGCDLRGATWSKIDFQSSVLVDIRLSYQTNLKHSLFGLPQGVVGLQYIDSAGAGQTTYDPAMIAEFLRQLGASVPSDQSSERLSDSAARAAAALHRFLRLARQTYYFSNDDFQNRGLQGVAFWPDILSLLKQEGLIEDTRISRRGSKGDVMKLVVSAEALERGERGEFGDERVRRFWNAVRSL